jgi:hypothetical protein
MKKIIYLFFITMYSYLTNLQSARLRIGKKKNRTVQKQYKTQRKYVGKIIPRNTEISKTVTQASRDAATIRYTLGEIINQSIQEANLINTKLNSAEEAFITNNPPHVIKAALLIIFIQTLQEAFNLNAFTTSVNNTDAKEKSNVEGDEADIIKNNIALVTNQFKNDGIMYEIANNSNTVISLASKICAEMITNFNNTKHTIFKKNNFYDLNKNIASHIAFGKFLAHEYGKEAKEVLAAHIILFGIKNFKSEIKQTLQLFSESTCLKSLIIASTTEPARFMITEDTTFGDDTKQAALLTEKNLLYQKASLEALHKIAEFTNIKLDMSKVTIPKNIVSSPWSISWLLLSGGLSFAAGFYVGDLAYKKYLAYNRAKKEAEAKENELKEYIASENKAIENNRKRNEPEIQNRKEIVNSVNTGIKKTFFPYEQTTLNTTDLKNIVSEAYNALKKRYQEKASNEYHLRDSAAGSTKHLKEIIRDYEDPFTMMPLEKKDKSQYQVATALQEQIGKNNFDIITPFESANDYNEMQLPPQWREKIDEGLDHISDEYEGVKNIFYNLTDAERLENMNKLEKEGKRRIGRTRRIVTFDKAQSLVQELLPQEPVNDNFDIITPFESAQDITEKHALDETAMESTSPIDNPSKNDGNHVSDKNKKEIKSEIKNISGEPQNIKRSILWRKIATSQIPNHDIITPFESDDNRLSSYLSQDDRYILEEAIDKLSQDRQQPIIGQEKNEANNIDTKNIVDNNEKVDQNNQAQTTPQEQPTP